MMSTSITNYNDNQLPADKEICITLEQEINRSLPMAESKIWHGSPVWFLEGNPVVGYSKQKRGVRLMFWSGADFDEKDLEVGTGKFKDASIFYNSAGEIDTQDLKRWLTKAISIQWDYKNIVKRRGVLERLK